MKVYLIRHGETHANAQKRFAGHWDVELTDRGKEQAVKAGEALKDVVFDRAVASDLKRARETAEAIMAHQNCELVLNPEIREMNFGIWEQKTFKEIGESDPELLNKWFEDFKNFEVPEGESVQALYDRVVKAYEAFIGDLDKDSKTCVLLVAHGGVIQALLSYLCFGDVSGYWKFRIDNCKTNCIEYVMGTPIVQAINQ